MSMTMIMVTIMRKIEVAIVSFTMTPMIIPAI